jgi:adenylate cyclase
MLSAFILRTRQLILASCVAIALELALQFKAGDTFLGKVGSVTTIALAAVLCEVALARRVQLAHRISEERVRLEKLGRYFSPQVATRIQQSEDDLATGQLCEITVLFSDLRGFTAATECSSPPEVLALLNEFHSQMVAAVFAHNGTLDKYMGDGLMAYFGAPMAQPDHPVQALRCAFAMQSALVTLNAARMRESKPPLRLSVGLHTGPAVVGAIGPANRREFTAVGDTVNIAARLENLTRHYETEMLISGETARRIGSIYDLRLLAETQVKGRAEPIQVFVPALRHPSTQLLPAT